MTFRVRSLAWYIQGLAYEGAKRGCPKEAKDPVKAAKCFKIAANLVRQSSSDDSIVWPIRLTFCSSQDHDGNDEYQNKFDSILSDLSNNETSEVLNAVNEQELAAKFGTPVRQEQKYFRAKDYNRNISLQESIERDVGSILLQVKVSISSSLGVENALNRDIFDRGRFSWSNKSLPRSILRFVKLSRKG